MATWTICAARPTRTPDGWFGVRQVPTFTVEALTVDEALGKAADVLGGGDASLNAWSGELGVYGEAHASDGAVVPKFMVR